MLNSTIEWTEATWNPVRGCTRVSPGCVYCYAESLSARFSGAGLPYEGFANMTPSGPRWTGEVRLIEKVIEDPLRWRRPRTVFVNSMSDLFHEKLPIEDIRRVFAVMNKAAQHRFQVLTKRSKRLCEIDPQLLWAPNIWMGVSVESADYTFRIDDLRRTGAAIKFLSLEPLLRPLPNLNLEAIDWVIVGGESGRGARPMNSDWARDIRDQCRGASVPFFFKQYGRKVNNPDALDPTAKENGGTAKGGRILDGRTWDEMPAITTVRMREQVQVAAI